ncbi:integrating conjugative element protein [Cellvibrio sp. PSBB023]|nr:integrating conjugative element protein [Cellvibrio sp. PSBB023]
MKKIMWIVLIAMIPLHAFAERTVVWNKFPITIVLPVGEEIRVSFPTDITLQVPMEVTERLESLAPNQRVVYWKATEAFDTVRVIATATDNDSVYLIDLVGQHGATAEPLYIEDPDRVIAQKAAQQTEALSESVTSPSIEQLDPPEILLTRFASQTLYAPRRLMPVNPDINAQPVPTITANFPLMRSQSGEQYQYSIVGAWAGYGRFITAVMVENKSPVSVQINPGLINGNFTHITAQHLYLGAAGTLEDRTTLYLISDAPFTAAVMEDGYGY